MKHAFPVRRGASMMQIKSPQKPPVAVPTPTDTTGLAEAEAVTYKIDHQTDAGNGLTLNERG